MLETVLSEPFGGKLVTEEKGYNINMQGGRDNILELQATFKALCHLSSGVVILADVKVELSEQIH